MDTNFLTERDLICAAWRSLDFARDESACAFFLYDVNGYRYLNRVRFR